MSAVSGGATLPRPLLMLPPSTNPLRRPCCPARPTPRPAPVQSTGKQQSITIQSSGGLSEQQIQQMVGDAERYAAKDSERKAAIEARNEADSLIYSGPLAAPALAAVGVLLSPAFVCWLLDGCPESKGIWVGSRLPSGHHAVALTSPTRRRLLLAVCCSGEERGRVQGQAAAGGGGQHQRSHRRRAGRDGIGEPRGALCARIRPCASPEHTLTVAHLTTRLHPCVAGDQG